MQFLLLLLDVPVDLRVHLRLVDLALVQMCRFLLVVRHAVGHELVVVGPGE